MALTASDAQGTPLPSFERLLRLTYQTVRADQASYQEGITFLRRARAQARKAKEAHEAGDSEAARTHAARSHALQLRAILSVLGTQVAVDAVAGVDGAMARLEAHLAGKTLTEGMTRRLNRARTVTAGAHEALAAGNHLRALNGALVAADLIRSFSPRYQARKAIERATRAFRAAYELVKNDATDQEKAALRQARTHLDAAKGAFGEKKFRLAKRYANASAKLSLEVLQGRSP
jgi:HEPN domain-containing protein